MATVQEPCDGSSNPSRLDTNARGTARKPSEPVLQELGDGNAHISLQTVMILGTFPGVIVKILPPGTVGFPMHISMYVSL